MKTVNILGTKYNIYFKSEDEETRLKDNWGFTDFHTKEIYVRDDIAKKHRTHAEILLILKRR